MSEVFGKTLSKPKDLEVAKLKLDLAFHYLPQILDKDLLLPSSVKDQVSSVLTHLAELMRTAFLRNSSSSATVQSGKDALKLLIEYLRIPTPEKLTHTINSYVGLLEISKSPLNIQQILKLEKLKNSLGLCECLRLFDLTDKIHFVLYAKLLRDNNNFTILCQYDLFLPDICAFFTLFNDLACVLTGEFVYGSPEQNHWNVMFKAEAEFQKLRESFTACQENLNLQTLVEFLRNFLNLNDEKNRVAYYFPSIQRMFNILTKLNSSDNVQWLVSLNRGCIETASLIYDANVFHEDEIHALKSNLNFQCELEKDFLKILNYFNTLLRSFLYTDDEILEQKLPHHNNLCFMAKGDLVGTQNLLDTALRYVKDPNAENFFDFFVKFAGSLGKWAIDVSHFRGNKYSLRSFWCSIKRVMDFFLEQRAVHQESQ
ncbi:hypothetical protein FACS1894113_2070 [Alphaproteobacteria bacterium]|nr:hypothetical protein FACS1894113_2070 [Alphaproteobacteria bacterium]